MKKDGPEGLSITERLKAKSAEDLRDVERVIQTEHARLAESLKKSSQDALSTIEENIRGPMTEIEREINHKRAMVMRAMSEIHLEPIRSIRNTMLISALIGAVVATVPWAIMSYWQRDPVMFEERQRISAMQQIEIMTIEGQEMLMLPNTLTQVFDCHLPTGTVPCIKLGE